MPSKLLDLVAKVIAKSTKDRPADASLRGVLRAQAGLSPDESAEVSRAVFAYYRWLGWLDQREPVNAQIESALQLADQYKNRPKSFSDEELLDCAVPGWLKGEMELTPDWARSIQREPKLWLRARPGQGNALADALEDCHNFDAGPLADILDYQGRADLFRTSLFHDGNFEVQDISSQAVGFICGPKPGETWLDACAGEGGKLLHLSDLMENKGLIWAADRALWRLQRLKRRAARARAFNYRTALWDGGPRLPTKTKFDGLLVDAPCSGVGTWQRNPHARWTTTPTDVQELAELQKRLLSNAAPAVKPGGKLVYSVCTLTRAETIEVADSFEQRCPGFQPAQIQNPLNQTASKATRVHFLPQEFGGNGMFVAVWTRARS